MDAMAAGYVITVAGEVLRPGWVGFEEGVIREVREGVPPAELATRNGGPHSILIPGLVSAHTHLALGDLRSIADDRPFLDWILRGLLPAIEEGSRREGFFRDGARRSARELLAGGVTLVADNFLRAEGVQALRETGQKGIFFQEVFGSLAEDECTYIAETRTVLDDLPAQLGGFAHGYSPHTPWTCPARTMEWVGGRARDAGVRLSFHLDESLEEHCFLKEGRGPIHDMVNKRGTLDRYRFGATPTAYARERGVLGPHALAVHCVQITAEDVAILAETGTSVAHCPISNAKLAEGIAPVRALLDAGVNVALGVDSAASTGVLDLFAEMRACLLTQRAQGRSVGLLTAATVLRMATLAGARALGRDGETGSIEVGKAADLVLLDASRSRHQPIRDPVATVVFACTADDVTATVIDGRVRYLREGPCPPTL